jgi:hypothetical protein
MDSGFRRNDEEGIVRRYEKKKEWNWIPSFAGMTKGEWMTKSRRSR